jgi:glutaconate CoA-transferase subunit B
MWTALSAGERWRLVIDDSRAATGEIMASVLAGELRDGERLSSGANSPIARAAVLLAHLTRGPNMKVFSAMGFSNWFGTTPPPATTIAMDPRAAQAAEGYLRHDETLEAVPKLADLFFVGMLQADPFGNSNLIGLKNGTGRLAWRGGGALATTTMATEVSRYYLVTERHTPNVFVEECDYVSCLGWGRPDRAGEGREDLGLAGGPAACVTPLAVIEYPAPGHRARIRSVHPGVTVEQVREATGFDLGPAEGVPTTPAPSPAELGLLRTVIDPEGRLRRR